MFLILDNFSKILQCKHNTADTDLLKMVPVEILLNIGNYFCTLQLGFRKFISWKVFLHYKVCTRGLKGPFDLTKAKRP